MKRLIICLTLLLLISLPGLCFGGNTLYVTPTGIGTKSGATPGGSMGVTELELKWAEGETAASGDTWYVLAGNSTYNAVGNWGNNAEDGVAAQPIMVVGVTPFDTTANELAFWPNNVCSGTSRPLISLGANRILVDNFWQLHGLMIEGTANAMIDMDIGPLVSGCSIYNIDSVNAGREALVFYSYATVYNSGIASSSPNSRVIFLDNNYNKVLFCYLHNGSLGVDSDGIANVVQWTIFDTFSSRGISDGGSASLMANCTFIDCVIGIESDGDDYLKIILGNIFEGSTTAGIAAEKTNLSRVIDYNNYWNNTADITNDVKGLNATAFDPNFTNYVPDEESGVTSAGKAMKDPYGAGE